MFKTFSRRQRQAEKVDIFCYFISLNHELAKYGLCVGQNCLPSVFAEKVLL